MFLRDILRLWSSLGWLPRRGALGFILRDGTDLVKGACSFLSLSQRLGIRSREGLGMERRVWGWGENTETGLMTLLELEGQA